MNRRILLLIMSLSVIYLSDAQTGGSRTYDFLNLTNSARVAALGGKNISLNDNDLNLAFHNPALLTPAMDKNLVINYVAYFADINYGYTSYALDMEKLGTFAIGMHYINYGTFEAADPDGTRTGKFYGADYALNLIYSRPIDSFFRVGVNIKPLYSHLEHYMSYGIAADLGITFTFNEGLSTLAATIRNAGFQVKSYTGNYREPIPFELLLGFTHKLKFAPFRLSITACNLQKYKLTYDKTTDNETDINGTGQQQSKLEKFADNFFRHFIAGVEFVPGRVLFASISYNYQRRSELALDNYPGTVGFSYGFGLRLKKFSLAYGRAVYHAAGGSNHLSFSLNFSQIFHQ
jgi:hypothetical protein